MGKTSNTAKLIAFAIVVFGCAGVPHFLYDHAIAAPVTSANLNSLHLLPASVGYYALRTRTSNAIAPNVIEQVAVFVNVSNHEIVQISTFLNGAPHDGIDCYLTRGIPVVWSGTEEVQARDSVAYFRVSVLKGNSIDASTDNSYFLIAAAECAPDGCSEEDVTQNQFGIFRKPVDNPLHRVTVPISIVLQPAGFERTSTVAAQKDALLRDLRQFMIDLPLHPLNEFARTKFAANKP